MWQMEKLQVWSSFTFCHNAFKCRLEQRHQKASEIVWRELLPRVTLTFIQNAMVKFSSLGNAFPVNNVYRTGDCLENSSRESTAVAIRETTIHGYYCCFINKYNMYPAM